MANSVGPIYRGLDYQATLSWMYICDMLSDFSCVDRIQFESTRIKSFDDIIICYKESKPRESQETGRSILFDCFQIKFHIAYDGAVSFDNLMDPAFIGAKKYSILQKLTTAVRKLGKDACNYRFTLTMPWCVDPNDLLAKVLSTHDGEIIISRLFDGTSKKSKTGKLRQKLMNHMGIDSEIELRNVLSLFRIHSESWTEQKLIENLNFRLFAANLKPITGLANPYSQFLLKWSSQGIVDITPSFVNDICKKENLFITKQISSRIPVGIRSFYRGTENMQDITDRMLCLLPDFNGRFLKPELSWDADIKPKVESFLTDNLSIGKSYRIYLDTHYSIAFAAGRALDSKSGIDIVPIQKTQGKPSQIWEPAESISIQGNEWEVHNIICDSALSSIAVTFSATHSIADETTDFIRRKELGVGEIIHFRIPLGTHLRSVVDGTHAYALAQAASKIIYEKTRALNSMQIHLFMAIPVSLCFFLGQISRSWGTCLIYEYDFEHKKTYFPAMTL